MRDKKGSKVFTRKVDTTHPANIRVIIPPAVYEVLKQPEEVTFKIVGKQVILSA